MPTRLLIAKQLQLRALEFQSRRMLHKVLLMSQATNLTKRRVIDFGRVGSAGCCMCQ
jgi:hypothetical protein